MLVVNFWGGPSAGKSVMAAQLFSAMKIAGERVELVTEYAKELVYERRDMTDQLTILAQQNKRLRRLRGHVDYVITDSPIPMGLIYASSREGASDWFIRGSIELFRSYSNFNVFINRAYAFQPYGRVHNEAESRALDSKLRRLLRALVGDDYSSVQPASDVASTLYREVQRWPNR